MKSLKEFVTTNPPKKEEITKEQVSLELPLELQDSYDIQESGSFKQGPALPSDPPAMLLMRRTSIRLFPNGQRVALYFVDKINKYISVPYTPMQWASHSSYSGLAGVKEEIEIVEQTIVEHLKDIVENNSAKTIMFEDGNTKRVDVRTATRILEVYNSLDKENKKMVTELGQQSREVFDRLIDFSWSHKK